ncbi:MAG: site-specific integrase [Bacteroidales bacterium]|nr:site-specific integrase [Bacteroidales bacterium]
MGLAKIVFWSYQTNKDGESPIFIRVIEDRKPRYIKTGFNCTEKDWDSKENRFRTNYRKAEDLQKAKDHERNNELLLKKLNDANKVIKDLIADDNVISSEQVKEEMLRAKSVGKHSVLSFIDKVVEEKRRLGNLGTAKCYKDLGKSFETFLTEQNKTDVVFKEITYSFLKKYENYFLSKGATGNGISFYMRSLRAVFNRAIQEKVCKIEMYPFNSYKIASLSSKTAKRAITRDEIEKIKGVDLEDDAQKIRSKNLFLFSYYCRGLNFVDMAMLKWKNIKDNRLGYIRQKTHKPYNVLLLAPALEILSYYKQKFYRGDKSYIFPILDEDKHKTQESINNRLHKVLGQTNKDLKVIGNEAKLSIPLTTYVARHTYATVMKRSGVSTSIISEALGHDSERTTQIYLDSFANDVLDEASNAIL